MSTISPDTLVQPPFPVRRFTVKEYHRLGELGVLTDEDAVELLAGWIVPKMIHNPLHDATVELVHQALQPLIPAGWRIRIQSAITTPDSEPEPDVAIVRGSIQDHIQRHPSSDEISLVVEIADSSLQRDRLKASLYARSGISHYWIVNLVDSQLEIHSNPSTNDAGYLDRIVLDAEQTAAVVIAESTVGIIPLRHLFPSTSQESSSRR